MQRHLRKQRLRHSQKLRLPLWHKFKDLFNWRVQNFLNFLHKLFIYVPFLYRDKDWEPSYLLELMEYKLRCMAASHDRDPHHPGAPRYAQQIRVAAMLLKRMREHEYVDFCKAYDSDQQVESANFRRMIVVEDAMYKQDMEMFTKMFVKHHADWWH